MSTTKKLKIIDVFSGVGGLSYGFAQSDQYEIVAANEILPNMAKAYALNHPSVKMYVEDIKNFNAQNIEKDLHVAPQEIDIVIGGPPCQAYSTVGKRSLTDPRALLFEEYYRVLKEFNPKLFLFENVKGLLSMRRGELFKTIITRFESLGYRISYKLLNAADYGVPQTRERIIIIGSKLKTDFQYPEPTHFNPEVSQHASSTALKPYVTLEEAIGDLPFIASNAETFEYAAAPQNDFQKLMRTHAPPRLMDHNSPYNNPKLVKIMELLPDGGTPKDLPKALRPTSGFKNTYCRLWWEKPSTTITRNLSTPSSSRCIHPKAPRPLTTREGARIQCFPDDYQFYGSRGDKNLQIGNAVPAFLSSALAKAILENFTQEKRQEKKKTVLCGGGYVAKQALGI